MTDAETEINIAFEAWESSLTESWYDSAADAWAFTDSMRDAFQAGWAAALKQPRDTAEARLITVLVNVLSEDQLDAAVPALGGQTARQLLREVMTGKRNHTQVMTGKRRNKR